MQYSNYLEFLAELRQELEHLSAVGQKKLDAVQSHDLDELNDCIKEEQAISLTLRGCEQKRQKILSELGFQNVPLHEMPLRCPEEFRAETSRLVEELLRTYSVVQSVQSPARTIMEQELRSINTELESRGAAQNMDENYQMTPGPRPSQLRTDFRA